MTKNILHQKPEFLASERRFVDLPQDRQASSRPFVTQKLFQLCHWLLRTPMPEISHPQSLQLSLSPILQQKLSQLGGRHFLVGIFALSESSESELPKRLLAFAENCQARGNKPLAIALHTFLLQDHFFSEVRSQASIELQILTASGSVPTSRFVEQQLQDLLPNIFKPSGILAFSLSGIVGTWTRSFTLIRLGAISGSPLAGQTNARFLATALSLVPETLAFHEVAQVAEPESAHSWKAAFTSLASLKIFGGFFTTSGMNSGMQTLNRQGGLLAGLLFSQLLGQRVFHWEANEALPQFFLRAIFSLIHLNFSGSLTRRFSPPVWDWQIRLHQRAENSLAISAMATALDSLGRAPELALAGAKAGLTLMDMPQTPKDASIANPKTTRTSRVIRHNSIFNFLKPGITLEFVQEKVRELLPKKPTLAQIRELFLEHLESSKLPYKINFETVERYLTRWGIEVRRGRAHKDSQKKAAREESATRKREVLEEFRGIAWSREDILRVSKKFDIPTEVIYRLLKKARQEDPGSFSPKPNDWSIFKFLKEGHSVETIKADLSEWLLKDGPQPLAKVQSFIQDRLQDPHRGDISVIREYLRLWGYPRHLGRVYYFFDPTFPRTLRDHEKQGAFDYILSHPRLSEVISTSRLLKLMIEDLGISLPRTVKILRDKKHYSPSHLATALIDLRVPQSEVFSLLPDLAP